MDRFLIAVDLQNDFITGSLANPEAQKKLPSIKQYINERREAGDIVIFTLDTHQEDYLDTLEGKYLPVEHCINGTKGWELAVEPRVQEIGISKPTFGLIGWPEIITEKLASLHPLTFPDLKSEEVEFELLGFCTDICVVSNAILLRAYFLNCKIIVQGKYCAGTTKENHKAALDVMKSCQIDVNYKED